MSQSRVRPWRVVVIVEDDSDGRALKRLAEASRLSVQLDWLPANGIGNIKRRGDALIRLAADRIESGQGCVAIVVDRDRHDSRKDEPHLTIDRTCATSGIPYIEAVETLEAWLLADDGITQWLGLKERAQTDRVGDPKAVVSKAFLRKTGKTYRTRRARVQLAEKATGVNASRSRSWSQAIEYLNRCTVKSAPRKPR